MSWQAFLVLSVSLAIPLQALALEGSWRDTLQSAERPWSMKEGDGGLTFEVRPGDRADAIGDTGKALERSEIIPGHGVFDRPIETSWTFVWQREFGTPVPRPKYPWFAAGQWHATEDAGDIGAPPPVAIDLYGGVLRVCYRFSKDKPLKRVPPVKCSVPVPIKMGQPYRLRQVIVFPRFVDGGVLDTWLDGKQILSYRGPLGYLGTRPPYLKIGIYRSHSNDLDRVTYGDVKLDGVK